MLLAIDVGNTQTHIGAFEGGDLVEHWRFATDGADTADELTVRLSSLLALSGIGLADIDDSIAASVVPRLNPEYSRMSERHLGGPCTMVGPGLRTGMPVRLDNPHELGADRLVNAIAAYDRFGDVCAVVDFGTAITFDAVSADGEYLGGVIGPGIQISMQALTERAARLPNVDLAEPSGVIGTTTQASLQSGMVYGFAGAIDAIASRIRVDLGGEVAFVATGGMAASITPFCNEVDEVDEMLTLTGLRLIHELNR